MAKAKIEELKNFAKKKKGECLSAKYKGELAKYIWCCKKGHTWEETWNHIRKEKSWCSICASRAKYTIEDLKKHAKLKGGKCLSKQYINNSTKYQWECKKGHIWEAQWGSVKNIKTWCSVCAGRTKDTIDQLKAYAKLKEGKCLSDKYINSKTKYQWECKKGHVWYAQWTNIKNQRYWCPVCARNAKHSIEQLQTYAKEKGGKCLSKIYVNSVTKYEWSCEKKHIWESTWGNIKNSKHWCSLCVGHAKPTIGELKAHATIRGGSCLSEKYINSSTKYKWQCDKGHSWETRWESLKQKNTWCPVCAGNAKYTIEHLKAYAKGKGGKCLSLKYVNNHTKYRWQCKNRHIWEGSWHFIKQYSGWCHVCSRKGRKLKSD